MRNGVGPVPFMTAIDYEMNLREKRDEHQRDAHGKPPTPPGLCCDCAFRHVFSVTTLWLSLSGEIKRKRFTTESRSGREITQREDSLCSQTTPNTHLPFCLEK